MDIQPENLKKSWISRHPRVVIGIILVVCLGPFVNKAIHVDDSLFVWAGQWIQQHPADFYGSRVNWTVTAIPMWEANLNPPLMSCLLAAVATVFGWHEIALHLAGLAVAFMAAAGIYSLARMWCGRPLLAAVVAVFMPVFLVSSSTLMCDVLMLAFWVWALVFWERALVGNQNGWAFAGAGALAGLAVLSKYSAVTLLPLLFVLAAFRTRKAGGWLVGMAVPLLMMAIYEWLTAGMYGRGLLSAAIDYSRAHHFDTLTDWDARGVISLAYAGGCLLPLLFFAPGLWRPRTLLAGGVVVFGLVLVTVCLLDNPGLPPSWEGTDLMARWDIIIQLALLAATGLHLFLLTAADVGERRDTVSVILLLWITGGFLFAGVINWTLSARSFLPLVPAAAILLVRRWDAAGGLSRPGRRAIWPLIPAAVIALGLVRADCRVADSARTAARQIAAQYTTPGHTLWFEGHWGFQYYLEKSGGRPIDAEQSVLQPGDMAVFPFDNYLGIPLPPGSVGWVADLQYSPGSWINLSIGAPSAAGGFYSFLAGPVPFSIGKSGPHVYSIVKVLSPVPFNPHPALPAPEPIPPAKPGVADEMQLADRSQMDGDVRAAIQHYRKALAIDPDDPMVLNNLAWLLATAGKPELRDGPEAVRLATRAVELTDGRWPVFFGTLAAAYAQTGQFSKAIQMTDAAFNLARATGKTDVAAQNAKLRRLYTAGKTIGAAVSP